MRYKIRQLHGEHWTVEDEQLGELDLNNEQARAVAAVLNIIDCGFRLGLDKLIDKLGTCDRSIQDLLGFLRGWDMGEKI